MCRLYPCYVDFLQDQPLLSAGLEHSRSNLVFEIPNDFIFGMLYLMAYILEATGKLYVQQ